MKKLILIIFVFFIWDTTFSGVIVVPNNPSGSCSDLSVSFVCVADIIGTGFNFNSGVLPTGWKGSPYTLEKDFCKKPYGPSKTHTPYFWATTLVNKIRFISTNELDVSVGGIIKFDMRYGRDDKKTRLLQKNRGCEDPDEPDEGVFLQYSLDGEKWINIHTWIPQAGYKDSPDGINLYQWTTFSYLIPDTAKSKSTMFRWFQPQNSGPEWDNWGLDDIEISIFKTIVSQEWSYGDGTTSTTFDPTHVFPGSGTYKITLTAIDSGGDVHKVSFYYTILDNQNPTIDQVADIDIYEDCGKKSFQITGLTDGDICINQNLSFTITSSDQILLPDPKIVYVEGEEVAIMSVKPNLNQNGKVIITLTVFDDGKSTGGGAKSTTIRFLINVHAVNDPPVSDNLVINMEKNSSYNFELSNFKYYDIEHHPNIGILIVLAPTKGTLTFKGKVMVSNTFCTNYLDLVYTPFEDEIGEQYAFFSFRIIDQLGAESIDDYWMSFNVEDINSKPVSVDDTCFVYVNHDVRADVLRSVLKNDYDIDNDILVLNTFEQPKNGTIDIYNNGQFTYSPNNNFVGIDSIKYDIIDGNDTSDYSYLKIIVDTARWNGNENFISVDNWNGEYIPSGTDDVIVESGKLSIKSNQQVKSLFLRKGVQVYTYLPYSFTINGFLNNFGGKLKSIDGANIFIKGNLLKNNIIESKNSTTISIQSEVEY